ncbi:MAG: AI-2E family transporter [Vulcanimicrobiaceae bacterium]
MDARLNTALKVLAIIVLSAIILVGALDFLGHVRTIATIIIGAIFLCYVIYPVVRILNRRLPLWASILIVYALVILAVAAAVTSLVPALAQNIQQLVRDAPQLTRHAEAFFSDPKNPIIAHLPPGVRLYIIALPTKFQMLLQRYGQAAATSVMGVIFSTFTFVAIFIVIPIIALYILVDADTIQRSLLGLFSLSVRPRVKKIIDELDTVIGGFVRGQLMVAATVGFLVFLMLTILHVKYALLIGIVAGVLEVIPYVGAFVGAVPAVFIALFTNGWENAIFVVIGFIVINQLEGNLIAPFIVSESVGLSPLIVIIALFAGAELFGLPGLILAVPIAGAIKVLLANLLPIHEAPEIVPTLRKPPRRSPRLLVKKKKK